MKMIFITNLSSVKSLGPSWSVPARIKAQEKIDDVLWVNCTDAYIEHWGEVKCYHNLSEYGGKLTLKSFPEDFQKPDLVVFEDFYYPNCIKFHFELLKKNIPYIIVPRGALTSFAQKSKWLKKKIANFLLFSHFLRNALCIQYLTKKEYCDSTDKWNKRHIIIPNGFDIPVLYRKNFSTNGINAVFIGRLNAYHKGIDLFIEACEKVKDVLINRHFSITLYGERNRDYELLNNMVKERNLTKVITFGGEAFSKEKEKVLLNADLFVMTSRFEGLPMGLLEALAYGIPVFVTPGTNMAEEIINFNAGWTTETEVNAISQSLLQVMSEWSEAAKRGANARILANNYNWDKLACDFHDQIVKLLNEK